MKIFFARHGESQANLLHIISNRRIAHGLTDVGRKQAARLAEKLQKQSIIYIYSSPVLRAVQTARIISNRLGLTFEEADGLREFDCGVAEGRSDAQAWQLWQAEYDAWAFKHDYTHQIEGGESFQDIQDRFLGFIAGLIKAYSDTSSEIVCISHGGILSVMFPWVMRNVTPAVILKYKFNYTACIVAEYQPGGLQCVEWDGHPVGKLQK